MKKTRWTSENKVFKILLGRKSWLCFLKILYILLYHLINYREVTFGFSTLLLSLILGVVTFGWLKRVLHMSTLKNKTVRNMKGILFEKKVMYILYFRSYE